MFPIGQNRTTRLHSPAISAASMTSSMSLCKFRPTRSVLLGLI